MSQANNRGEKNKGRIAGIAAASAAGVLAAGYLILCGLGSSGDTFRRGTEVNGISIEKMTVEEASALLTGEFAGKEEAAGVSYGSLELHSGIEGAQDLYTLRVSDCLDWNFDGILAQTYEAQRGGSFFTQGVHLVKGGSRLFAAPSVQDGDALEADLEACGILDLDTSVQASYEVQGDQLVITKGSDGYRVDGDALKQTILENTAAGNYDPITCTAIATQGSRMDIQTIYDELYTEAENATLDVAEDRTYTIVDSSVGIDFDKEEAGKELEAAADGSSVTLPLIIQEPSIDTDTLKECLFRDVLGEYTTSVGGTAARRSNVKLAGSKCDGYILLPGEEFDYNATVGQRTAEAGFQAAAAYSNGETVQELGGGVCQVSSTLYCACLYANLEITARKNHTYVSSYVPIGMDATVSWGGPEFRFVNNTDYPIKLECTYVSDRITFRILGTDVNHYTVKITSETLRTISPGVKQVEDSSMAAGTTATVSSGHTGYEVQTYRHVYDQDGNLVSEGKEAYSYYSPSASVVHIGTRQEDSSETDTDAEGGEAAEGESTAAAGTAGQ